MSHGGRSGREGRERAGRGPFKVSLKGAGLRRRHGVFTSAGVGGYIHTHDIYIYIYRKIYVYTIYIYIDIIYIYRHV